MDANHDALIEAALNTIKCPRCQMIPGIACTNEHGDTVSAMHFARIVAYRKLINDAAATYWREHQPGAAS